MEQPETLRADVPGEAPSCTGDLTGSPSKAQSPSRAEQAITTKSSSGVIAGDLYPTGDGWVASRGLAQLFKTDES